MIRQVTDFQKVIESRAWWKFLGDKIGWRLHGWTEYNSAHFLDARNRSVYLDMYQAIDLRIALGLVDKPPV